MRDVTSEEDEVPASFNVSHSSKMHPLVKQCRSSKSNLGRMLASLSPDRIVVVLDMCLRSTYFSDGGEFYEQREGVALGSSLSLSLPLPLCSGS